MTTTRSVVELPAAALAQLPSAIAALLPEDRWLLTALLELGYLAASADGLDATERDALATILERATGETIDGATFRDHFVNLDAAVASLGRRERLARTAADFTTDEARANAIEFAALVSMSDGTLHEHELGVLAEVATHFDWGADRVRKIVDELATRIGGKS
jgi:tellurite resistance protein